MALEFLGNFKKRTLDSLARFRGEARSVPAPSLDELGAKLYDGDLDAWERAKALMDPETRERFRRMGEELCREDVCVTCGGREINGSCVVCRRLRCDA